MGIVWLRLTVPPPSASLGVFSGWPTDSLFISCGTFTTLAPLDNGAKSMRGLSLSVGMSSQVPSGDFLFLSLKLRRERDDNAALAGTGQSHFFQLWPPLAAAYK